MLTTRSSFRDGVRGAGSRNFRLEEIIVRTWVELVVEMDRVLRRIANWWKANMKCEIGCGRGVSIFFWEFFRTWSFFTTLPPPSPSKKFWYSVRKRPGMAKLTLKLSWNWLKTETFYFQVKFFFNFLENFPFSSYWNANILRLKIWSVV